MNGTAVGRVLPASLHQGIADVLPLRIDFYEEWLNPKAMRDGRIGLAPIAAVLSFLRLEGEAYHQASARAGEVAADWTLAGARGLERAILPSAPVWIRMRLAARLMQRLAGGTYGGCRVRIRWSGREGTMELSGSVFCTVRDRSTRPLCEYYAAAMRRLLERAGLPAEVTVTGCRAAGAETCAMTMTLGAL